MYYLVLFSCYFLLHIFPEALLLRMLSSGEGHCIRLTSKLIREDYHYILFMIAHLFPLGRREIPVVLSR